MSRFLALAFVWAALIVACAWNLAWSQVGSPTLCGPTSVGATATGVTYPASGGGPQKPSQYVSIANPNSSGYFCVAANATAAVSGTGCAAGSFYVGALSSPLAWYQPSFAPPATLSIVGSTGGMAVTCFYQ